MPETMSPKGKQALDLHHEAKVVLGPYGYEALTAFSQALEQLDERVLYYDIDST